MRRAAFVLSVLICFLLLAWLGWVVYGFSDSTKLPGLPPRVWVTGLVLAVLGVAAFFHALGRAEGGRDSALMLFLAGPIIILAALIWGLISALKALPDGVVGVSNAIRHRLRSQSQPRDAVDGEEATDDITPRPVESHPTCEVRVIRAIRRLAYFVPRRTREKCFVPAFDDLLQDYYEQRHLFKSRRVSALALAWKGSLMIMQCFGEFVKVVGPWILGRYR